MCIFSLGESEFVIDLIVLHVSEFNVILAMDWLSSCHISSDCFYEDSQSASIQWV